MPKLPPTKNSRPRRSVRRENELAAKSVGWMYQEHEPLGAASPAHEAERSLELDVLRALRALRALPPDLRLRIAADVLAQHRDILEPAAEAPQQTEAQRAK